MRQAILLMGIDFEEITPNFKLAARYIEQLKRITRFEIVRNKKEFAIVGVRIWFSVK